MENLFGLDNKVAIVTGGSKGIGKAIATGLANAGANVVLIARNQIDIDCAVNEIRGKSESAVSGIRADILEEDQIAEGINHIFEEFGQIDILVNNAGINIRKYPEEYTLHEWDQMLDINLRGSFLCAKSVYPHMKKAGGGKIINIGSMTSIFGGAKLAPYAASKGGIVQLTKSLAVAWGPDNIQVNAILPGWINTELTIQAKADMEGLDERVIGRTPVGRWGETEDLAGLAIFLSGMASNFVTGTTIPVDGGFSVMI